MVVFICSWPNASPINSKGAVLAQSAGVAVSEHVRVNRPTEQSRELIAHDPVDGPRRDGLPVLRDER
jgi:hypothetical protein